MRPAGLIGWGIDSTGFAYLLKVAIKSFFFTSWGMVG